MVMLNYKLQRNPNYIAIAIAEGYKNMQKLLPFWNLILILQTFRLTLIY